MTQIQPPFNYSDLSRATPYKYLIYSNFPKINTSYHGTPGTTYRYLIYIRFPKLDKWPLVTTQILRMDLSFFWEKV